MCRSAILQAGHKYDVKVGKTHFSQKTNKQKPSIDKVEIDIVAIFRISFYPSSEKLGVVEWLKSSPI